MSDTTRRTLMIGLAATAVSLPLSGLAASAPFGPRVGTKAPPISPLADQDGRLRRVADLAGVNGVVLMFYRSVGWCPYCQAQIIAMQAGQAEFVRRGFKVVGVSYEAPAVNKTFTDRRGVTYPLLSDTGAKVIEAWGLRDPQYPEGHRAFGVPRPVIYVIDRQNTIRAALAESVYQNRPPVSEVTKVIDALR